MQIVILHPHSISMYCLSGSYTQTSPSVMLQVQRSQTVTKMFHDVVSGSGYADSIILAETTDIFHPKMTWELQASAWIVAKLVTRVD